MSVENQNSSRLSRRKLLQLSGGAAAGLALGVVKPDLGSKPREARASVTSETIDGVETFGHNQPLDQSQHDALVAEKNAQFGNRTLNNNTYYMTAYVTESQYERFAADNGESPQWFHTRHINALRDMLRGANPTITTLNPVTGLKDGGIILRRLVVIKEGVRYPSSFFSTYLSKGWKDSDGTFIVPSNRLVINDGRYVAAEQPNYNRFMNTDYGYIHELGHDVLHLNDQYALSVLRSDHVDQALLNILPYPWQEYLPGHRSDIARDDTMANMGPRVGEYTAWQLKRRIYPHDFAYTKATDLTGWPYELPGLVKFELRRTNNELISPSSIIFYRTQPTEVQNTWYEKRLPAVAVYQSASNVVKPTDLFERTSSGVIKDESATLLMIIRDATTNGNFFRWIDIRDFHLCLWQKKTVMRMYVASASDSPTSFPYKIDYQGHNIIIPASPVGNTI